MLVEADVGVVIISFGLQIVNIAYTKIPGEFPDELFKAYLAMLPPYLQTVSLRYRRSEDRIANLAGKLLLISGLRNLESKLCLNDLKFNLFGKPYFEGDINFSISHSGNYVGCAITKGSLIGLDIEQCRPIVINDFRQVFTPGQMSRVINNDDPPLAFFKLWTILESVIKADGRGMSIPLRKITLQNESAIIEGKLWFFKPIFLTNGYIAHLASENNNTNIYTEFTDLLATTNLSLLSNN